MIHRRLMSVTLACVFVAAASCAGPEAPTAVEGEDPGLAHVHGMGINPADEQLYVATHTGVFRLGADGTAERIADRYMDTMGFTVVGPDHFMASGHPDAREDLPPLLGLLESRDAARTWQTMSLLGEADFHALRYAHGRVYGYDSSGRRFMVSPDGKSWDTRSDLAVADLAVSPEDPDHILATTQSGLQRSTDGGRTWTATPGPSQPMLLGWTSSAQDGSVWVVTIGGEVSRSDDGGDTWEATGTLPGRPEAFLAGIDALHAAAAGRILRSGDAGRSWDTIYSEPGRH